MEKNKPTRIRPGRLAKKNQTLKPAESRFQDLKPHQPFCILDIRYGKARNRFEFIVSLNTSKKPHTLDMDVHTLDGLGIEYKIWLLAKFKENLRGLALVDRMKTWVLDRLEILKEYCEMNDISFDVLYTRSSRPINKSFCGTSLMSENSPQEKSKAEQVNSKQEGKLKKQRGTLSAREGKREDSLRFVLSKTARLRAMYNHIKIMISKYKTKKSIDKQSFLEDLDCMNAYVHDF